MAGPKPAATIQLPDDATLGAIERRLCDVPHDIGLDRMDGEGRAALGVPSTKNQLKKTLACLDLLRTTPELLRFFDKARVERWEQLAGRRLHVAQARRALRPLRTGAWRANLILLGRITEHNDHIEDALLSKAGPEAPPAERRRILSKFDDPASLRRVFDESAAERARRRQKRAAIKAGAAETAQALIRREQGVDQLRR